MIKNDKQYQYSQECARRFQNSIDALDRDEKMKAEEPNNWQMNRDVKQSHLTALQAEIAEYQKLINCDRSQPLEITVENFNQLPEALIKARIAAKMSQKELASMACRNSRIVLQIYPKHPGENSDSIRLEFVV